MKRIHRGDNLGRNNVRDRSVEVRGLDRAADQQVEAASLAPRTSHRAGTTLTAVPPEIAARLSLRLIAIASSAMSIALTPSAGVLEWAALPRTSAAVPASARQSAAA